MAETAKTVGEETSTTKKGRAKTTSEEKVKRKKRAAVTAEEPKKTDDEFLKSIREQIENCKEEIKTSLHDSISKEMKNYVASEVGRANRRRRWNNFFHDIVIIALAVVAVYFGYCLYDARYFSFLKTDCEKAGTCVDASQEAEPTAGPVKDATWYLANYRYLFDNIQTNLDADSLEAYYLYADDRKVSEIEPKYLLSMAYNQVSDIKTNEKNEKTFSSEQMSEAFRETFGSTELYAPGDFNHGCESFRYLKDSKSFISEDTDCQENSKREIVEKIDRIYEEGEVIYIATIAAIRDKTTLGLYNFNNLFKPVTLGVESEELGLYSESLNRYQYQFKKKGEQYYFAGITKIK